MPIEPLVEWPRGNGEQSVILPGEREKFFMKLETFKKDNLTQKENNEVSVYIGELVFSLRNIAYDFFGVGSEQLKLLEINELRQLDEEIYKKVRTKALAQKALLIAIPIFGWMFLFMSEKPFNYYNYTYNRDKLKNFFKGRMPYERILESLRK